MATNEERVKKVIMEQLGVNEDQVTDNASFVDDVGAVPYTSIFISLCF